MGKLIDEMGNRYGRLVIIERSGNNKFNCAEWLCRCDCGNEKVIAGVNLRRGRTKSCGCFQKERQREAHRLSIGEASFNALVGKMKFRADKRNFEWSLTVDQVRTLFEQSCYYCGIKPQQKIFMRSCYGSYNYNGLDRVDSSKGYSIENVVPCCGICNVAKNSMTVDQFREWTTRLYKHLIEKSDGVAE